MRPLSLKITGFGPFSGEQNIPFDSFSDIFLISGKTGSGKTTIFDAMMFALYGKVPGSRDPKGMVSDFIKGETVPSVTLDFSVRGQTYRITRQPAYSRAALKGKTRMVEVPATAVLEKKQGRVWTALPGKPTEITEHIEHLLRLTAEEFSKIVLLPQGEFQQFLMADTREKTRLLEKMFPTRPHEELSLLCKEKVREIKKTAELTAAEKTRLEKEHDLPGHDRIMAGLTESLEKSSAAATQARASLNAATERLARASEQNKDFIELEKNSSRLDELRSQTGAVESMADRARLGRESLDLMPHIRARHDTIKELKTLSSKLADVRAREQRARTELDRLVEEEKNIPRIEEEITAATEKLGALNILLEKSTALAGKKSEREKLGRACGEAEKKIEAACRETALAQDKRAAIKSRVSGMEKELLSYEETLSQLSGVTAACSALAAAEDKNRESAAIREKTGRAKNEHTKIEQGILLLKKNEEALLRKKEASAAALLALKLVAGEPCPVCGSEHHPAPAKGPDMKNGEMEKLDLLSSEIREKEKTAAGLAERLANYASLLASLENEIIKLTGEKTGTIDSLTEQKKALESRKKHLDAVRGALVSAREEHDSEEKRISALALETEKLNREIRDLLVARETLNNEISSLEKECGGNDIPATIEQLKKQAAEKKGAVMKIRKAKQEKEISLEGASREAASLDERTNSLEEKMQELSRMISAEVSARGFASAEEAEQHYLDKKDIESLEKKVLAFMDEKKSLEKTTEYLTKKTSGQKKPDIPSLEKTKEELSEKLESLESQKNEYMLKMKELASVKKQYDSLCSCLEKLQAESETMIQLSNELNGSNPKNLTFQNFVLGAYLEEVARFASVRLHAMSEERYTLVLNEEISHGNREAGLDLDVFDAFTGQKRSVKSLSGGEKFLASIALALGLADVIQARAGGIELDAIFIDEGFGSLDDAALDRALTILDDIRENRMVGIISHVNELKNRIPSRIQVIKDADGSRIVL
ncbi:MAG TPA: AAA family ATPase [Spirochaetota bacterium]|nr:AAA family ATPase [Spirochaetota bacterium]HPI89780.1 AAA family ATPase [Spirochaetota bacterium]HPR47579.1 AAA family ATPase [Spirochaetota bacterium]